MTTAQDQQSRAEFEAHMRKLSPCVRLYRHTCDGGDKYRTVTVQYNWELWQAARALPAGVEPVAFKVSDPGEPDIGFWLSETKGTRWQVTEALYTAAQVLAMGRVPPRYVAVPVEPTKEMREAGYDAYGVDGCYQSMLAAAPRPPAAQNDMGIPITATQELNPLTDERIRQLDDATHLHEAHDWPVRFARAIEAELRKKVTP